MVIRDELLLDLSQAIGQIEALQDDLNVLLQPIVIPVQVEADQSLNQLRTEIAAVDADDIDIDVDVDGVSEAEREFAQLESEVEDTTDELRKMEREADDATDAVLRIGTRGASVFTNLRGSLLGVAGAFGVFQAGGALFEFFRESIGAASDLEESTSKAQVVFGDFFEDIQAFAGTAPQALGLANQAALEFTGTFGNLFTALGLSQQAASDLAPEIVSLGADLASFNNLEVTDVLDKLRAGLVGEAEPLRTLGVNLSAARVEAKAFELGLQDATGAITDAAKVQARYAIILDDTATAQGDFARTADSIANRQRTLNAEFEAFSGRVGEALVPFFEELIGVAPKVLSILEDYIPVLADLALGLVDVVEGGTDFLEFLGAIPGQVDEGKDAMAAAADEGNALAGVLSQIGATPIGGIEDLVRESIGLTGVLERLRAQSEDDFGTPLGNLIASLDDFVPKGAATVDTLEEMGRAAGANDAEFAAFLRLLVVNADQLGITGIRVEDITRALAELGDEASRLPPPVDEVARAIANVADSADEIGPPLETAEDRLIRFANTVDAVSARAARGLNFDELVADIRELPSELDLAREAFQDAEGDIVTDFGEFLDNLERELEAQRVFETNLELLESLGFDNLADAFRAAGIESAQALADGLSDPAALAEGERLLEERGRTLAQAEAKAFGDEVAAFVAGAGESFGIIEIPVEPLFGDFTPPEIPGIEIPVRFQAGGNITLDEGALAGISSGTQVTNNFFTEPQPTTDTARISQATRNLIQ